MKGKYKKALAIGGAAVVIYLLCRGLIYLFDYFFNGALVDWFTMNYTYATLTSDGKYVYDINWESIKGLTFWVLIWFTLICVLIARIYARIRVRQSIAKSGTMIHDYMQGGRNASDVFPQEYAEISAQIVEIRSAMQRSEQILKEEAARKNDLIVYLAHDLKTPLTSIIGYLSLLEEIPEMPPEQRAKYVKITREKALRLETLINEFFDITRYNLQQITLEKEMVDLNYMLMQLTDEFYPLLSAHENTLGLEMDDGLMLLADPIKLARVFNNILKNAVAYSYPGTKIEVEARKKEKEICVTFSNQGKTIPEHKLESIFEKFFRLDDARNTNTGGAGLGLAIAKEIVELHGGRITAASTDGKTVFTVTLPQ
ncbi:MAG: HAMP domain-containing sensor histidine kinase [Eubacteriales bacterium]|nr:HAMP domain-containing sensor histidine kinase [Eubacteriales bacterium]